MKGYKNMVELEVLIEDAYNRIDLIKSMKDDLWSEIKIDTLPEPNDSEIDTMLGQAEFLAAEVEEIIKILKGEKNDI